MAEIKLENGKLYKKVKKEDNTNVSDISASSTPQIKYEDGKLYKRVRKGEAASYNTSSSSNSSQTDEDITNMAINVLKGGFNDATKNIVKGVNALAPDYTKNYKSLTYNDDFKENSDYRTSKTGEAKRDLLTGYYFDTGYGDIEHDIINGDNLARLYQNVNRGENQLEEKDYLTKLDDEQKSIYNYLYNTKGKDEAKQYIDSIKNDLYRNLRESEQETISSMSKENPFGMGLAVKPLLYGGEIIEGAAQKLNWLGSKVGLSEGFNENDPLYSRATRTRNSISQSAGDEVESRHGKAARFAFDTASMLGDYAFEMMLPGNSAAIAAGVSTSSQTTLNAMDRGIDADTSAALGIITGTIRGKLRSGQLNLVKTDYVADYASELPKLLADWKYVLKAAGNFAGASLISDVTSIASDTILAGDKSNFNIKVQNYINQGLSEEDAIAKAFDETLLDVVSNAGKSALTGGILAKLNSLRNNIVKFTEPTALIEENKPFDPSNKLTEIATEMFSEEPIVSDSGVDVVNTPSSTELSPYEPNTKPQAPYNNTGIKLPTNPITSTTETTTTKPETKVENPETDVSLPFPGPDKTPEVSESAPVENPTVNESEPPTLNTTFAINEYSKDMGENGRVAMRMFYNEDVPVDKYGLDARLYYTAGFSNKSIDDVVDNGVLNDAQKKALFRAGVEDAKKLQNNAPLEPKTDKNGNNIAEKPQNTDLTTINGSNEVSYEKPSFKGTIGQLTPEQRKDLEVKYDNDEDYRKFIEHNYVLGNGSNQLAKKNKIADYFESHPDFKERTQYVSEVFQGGINGEHNPVGLYDYNIDENGLHYSFGGNNGITTVPEHHVGYFTWEDIADSIGKALADGTYLEDRLPVVLHNKPEKEEENEVSSKPGVLETDINRQNGSGLLGREQTGVLSESDGTGTAVSENRQRTGLSSGRSDGSNVKGSEPHGSNGDSKGSDLQLEKIHKRLSVTFDDDVSLKYIPDNVVSFLKEADKLFKDYSIDKIPSVHVHNRQYGSDRSFQLNFYYNTTDENIAANVIPDDKMNALASKYAKKSGISAVIVKNSSNIFVTKKGFRKDGDNLEATYNVLINWNKDHAYDEKSKKVKEKLRAAQEANRKDVPNLLWNRPDVKVSATEDIPLSLETAILEIDKLFAGKEIKTAPKYEVWEHVPNLGPRYSISYYADDIPKGFEKLAERYKDDTRQIEISASIIPNYSREKNDSSFTVSISTMWTNHKPPVWPKLGDKLNKTTEEIVKTKTELANQEKPKGNNFVITEENFSDIPKTSIARFNANFEAVKLVKELNAENRVATHEEQNILSKFTGWGGIPQAFANIEMSNKLKQYLTEDEMRIAERTTLDAYYTNPDIITGIYEGLKSIGFTGGRILEPSSGVGRFFGAMPSELASKVSSAVGVELDSISGSIAKYLYPNNDIRIQPFQEARIPNNYMDLVIGNVPFGDKVMVHDVAYPKHITSSIHNYFVARSIDATRPGGIACLLVPKGLLDNNDVKTRQYFADKADFIGAIRLPSRTFSGTDVISDIVLFKKRSDGEEYSGEEFINTKEIDISAGYRDVDYKINEYFANNPHMVLGEMSASSSRWDYDLFVKAMDGSNIKEDIAVSFNNIKQLFETKKKPIQTKPNKKKVAGTITNENGKFRQTDEDGNSVEIDLTDKEKDILGDSLKLRDEARRLLEKMKNGESTEDSRSKLNELYDDFVSKHGNLHKSENKKAILKDSDGAFVLSLEIPHDSRGKEVTKSDVFSGDTVRSERKVTSVSNIQEGIIASINTYGRIDIDGIASMLGETNEYVVTLLESKDLAYKKPDGNYEIPEVYLSGNVKAKLREAENMLSIDKSFEKNVEALKKVIPEDIKAEDIDSSLGATWIPENVYSEFAAYMLGVQVKSPYEKDRYTVDVTYNNVSSTYVVEITNSNAYRSANNTNKWGTRKRPFIGDESSLLFSILNNKEIKVTKKVGDATVLDKKETDLALHKAELIKTEFKEWLWSDDKRRTTLSKLYNDIFNNTVVPVFDGSNLTIEGYDGPELRPHQKNAIQRIVLNGGNTLLAHRVGAGKTLEMICAAMKLKEIGAIKKPMFVVPKNIRKQWVKDFKDAFPNANVYEVTDGAISNVEKRREEFSRIANNDFDAIIVHYENFEEMPLSKDYLEAFYNKQIKMIDGALEAFKNGYGKTNKNFTTRRLEKMRNNFDAKLQDSMNVENKMKNVLSFEELGVDSLFVDEAHNFKNLAYITALNSSGIKDLGNQDGSNRAYDLYMKTRYLHELNCGKGLVFATATPVMNAVVEAFTMQRFLQEDTLVSKGIDNFDAWVKQFGEPENTYKLKPDGISYKSELSLSKYKNMPEFMQMWATIADVIQDIKDLPWLEIPKLKTGGRIIVECEPSLEQKEGMKDIGRRAQNPDTKGENHILALMSRGQKLSYSRKMLNPELSLEPEGKIVKCAENVLDIYNRTRKEKGTQIIFCDGGVPGGKQAEEGCNLYDEIRDILVNGGIPKEEIAYIHEADKPKEKEELFGKVNDGTVRVIIGSSAKLGTGVNIQKRAIAMHHINPVNRPGDLEQNEGRIIRQGNMFKEVEIYVYVTKGSFDSRQWDAIKRKSAFIYQVMNNTFNGRGAEGDSDLTLSAAEIASIASGNPLMLELFKVNETINKLELLESRHIKEVREAKENLEQNKIKIPYLKETIANLKEDIKTVNHVDGNEFEMTIGNTTYKADKHKEAGEKLVEVAKSKLNIVRVDEERFKIGKYAGFDMYVSSKGKAYLKGKLQYSVELDLEKNGLGALARIANLVKSDISKERLARLENELQVLIDNESKFKEIAESDFKEKDELIAARLRSSQIYAELEEYDKKIKEGEVDDEEFEEMYHNYIDTYNVYDSEGTELSKGQISKFKNSVVVDDNGNLLPVYHGTPDGGFTIFNPRLSYVSDTPSVANWFTTNLDIVNKYYNVDNSIGGSKQIYKCYINLEHPLIIDANGDSWNEINVDKDIREYFKAWNNYYKESTIPDTLNTERIAIYAKDKGYDGVIIKNVRDGSYEEEPTDVYAVFDSNNIKSVDNIDPTDDDDIYKAQTRHSASEWKTSRVGEEKENVMSLSDILRKASHDFNVHITQGYVKGAGVQGTYSKKNKGIRTKHAEDLITFLHELGHKFDDYYTLTGKKSKIPKDVEKELIRCFEESPELAHDKYSEKQKPGEGLAEWCKHYMRNSTYATEHYPKVTAYVLGKMTAKELENFNALADEVNAYLSAEHLGNTDMFRLKEEKNKSYDSIIEKAKKSNDEFIQKWFDSNIGIKKVSHNAYVLANNAAYAPTIAERILNGGPLTDPHGQYVGKGWKDILAPIKLSDVKTYKEFSKYLTDIHGPERLAQGKQVYANPVEDNVKFMNKEREYFEKLHPEWAKVAEEIFEFEDNFIKAWALETGLISEATYESWKEMYPHHVPLNRVQHYEFVNTKKGISKRFASQFAPFGRSKGSGLDIVSPIDNIMDEVCRVVEVASRNNVMLALREDVLDKKNEIFADIIEYIGVQKKPTEVDLRPIKDKIDTLAQKNYDSGIYSEEELTTIEDLLEQLEDVYLQFDPRNPDIKKGEITILVKGRPEWWKVNDELLLTSIINLNPERLPGWLRAYANTTRFMTSMITGNNPIWSIFSNSPRDLMTLLSYTQFKNKMLPLLKNVGKSYVMNFMSAIGKGYDSNKYHNEYLAIGGGRSSLYSADINSAKKARKSFTQTKWQRVLSNLNPIQLVAFLTDAIESGPREATYIMCRESGMSPEEALYNSKDITVNFARGGTSSRSVNAVVPFFNASMQGLDKFVRYITADDIFGPGGTGIPPKPPKGGKGSSGSNEEDPKKARAKVVASRIAWYVTASAIIAFLIYLLNNKDEESEEDYEQLSNYTKNTHWCIPIGNGKYFCIPKPREIAVLSSAIETMFEYTVGENEDAFNEFYSYALDQFFPSIIADMLSLPENIAKDGADNGTTGTLADIFGDLGILGVGFNVLANRDFLGRPIVSSAQKNLIPSKQYSNSTSKLSKWLGEAFNLSPAKIDYIADQLGGYFQKINKALFPVGESRVDKTLGIANTYIKDNQYSTDLVNKLYDTKEASTKEYNSLKSDDNYIKYQMDTKMTEFYSSFNYLNKLNTDQETSRENRQAVLDMVYDYLKSSNNNEVTNAQKIVYQAVSDVIPDNRKEMLPAVMKTEINGYKLNDSQYYEFQTIYNNYYYSYIEKGYRNSMSSDERIALVKKAYSLAKDKAENTIYYKYKGTTANNTFSKYDGVDEIAVVRFEALKQVKSMEDGKSGIKAEEVTEVLQKMINNYGLTRENARKLYKAAGYSDKNNPF